MVISSTTNANIKALRALYRDKKSRYEYGEYPIEGATIVKDMPKDIIERLFIRESDYEALKYLAENKDFFIVKDEIFDAVADTKSPSGVIAVAAIPDKKDISGDFTVVLCGLSDPGNVGTIIRTACAAGIKSIVCIDTADPFSPKAVRASMGGIFKTDIINADNKSVFEFLKDYKIAVLDMGGKCIHSYKQTEKIALMVGNEAHGVPSFIKEKSDIKLSIPMVKDSVESLNAAVACGIAIYSIINNRTE